MRGEQPTMRHNDDLQEGNVVLVSIIFASRILCSYEFHKFLNSLPLAHFAILIERPSRLVLRLEL